MSEINDGGPAFPLPETVISDKPFAPDHWGMTLRDYMAAKAMGGLLANPGGPFQQNNITGWGIVNCRTDDIANTAYAMADAMIAARKEQA